MHLKACLSVPCPSSPFVPSVVSALCRLATTTEGDRGEQGGKDEGTIAAAKKQKQRREGGGGRER